MKKICVIHFIMKIKKTLFFYGEDVLYYFVLYIAYFEVVKDYQNIVINNILIIKYKICYKMKDK